MFEVVELGDRRAPTEGRPRHLLGIGEIDDLVRGVELGIDTFDCAMPTRIGRHGMALVPDPDAPLARRPRQGALAARPTSRCSTAARARPARTATRAPTCTTCCKAQGADRAAPADDPQPRLPAAADGRAARGDRRRAPRRGRGRRAQRRRAVGAGESAAGRSGDRGFHRFRRLRLELRAPGDGAMPRPHDHRRPRSPASRAGLAVAVPLGPIGVMIVDTGIRDGGRSRVRRRPRDRDGRRPLRRDRRAVRRGRGELAGARAGHAADRRRGRADRRRRLRAAAPQAPGHGTRRGGRPAARATTCSRASVALTAVNPATAVTFAALMIGAPGGRRRLGRRSRAVRRRGVRRVAGVAEHAGAGAERCSATACRRPAAGGRRCSAT